MNQLYAYLFDNDLSTPEFVMDLTNLAKDITLLWQIPGGNISTEITIGLSSVAAYDFFSRYVGYRLIIADGFCDRPVGDGFITDVELIASGVKLIANGFWFRHYDQLFQFDTTEKDNEQGALAYLSNAFQDAGQDFSDWESASDPAVYEILITNDDNSYTSGFMGEAFTTGGTDDSIYVYQDYELTTPGWNNTDPTDKTPSAYSVRPVYNYKTSGEVVEECLSYEVPAISTNYDEIDDPGTLMGEYEPPWEEGGMYPGDFIIKMASLSSAGGTDEQWNYYLENMPFDGTTPQKPLAHFHAQVDDGTFNWDIRKWMIKGSGVSGSRNIQEMRNYVRAIYNDMENNNYVEITDAATDMDSVSKYWLREAIESAGDNVAVSAALYRNYYLSKYKDAQASTPITLSSPYLYDSNGQRCPLWAPIKLSKSYFSISDIFPDIDIFSSSWDRKTCGQAMQMEYSSSNNELRIYLDQESNELDAVIARMDTFR